MVPLAIGDGAVVCDGAGLDSGNKYLVTQATLSQLQGSIERAQLFTTNAIIDLQSFRIDKETPLTTLPQ